MVHGARDGLVLAAVDSLDEIQPGGFVCFHGGGGSELHGHIGGGKTDSGGGSYGCNWMGNLWAKTGGERFLQNKF